MKNPGQFTALSLCLALMTLPALAADKSPKAAAGKPQKVAAAKPESSAPKVVSEAAGDLNGDGRPDQVKVLQEGSSAKLVILLRGADGKLKQAAASSAAVMLACGPSGGLPSVEIKQGVLLVGHYCGARTRYEFTHKYQWRQNKWLLIGFTGNTNDTAAPDTSQTIDINFVTGDVAASFNNGKQKHLEHFLEVRAPHIVANQPGITDWSVPRIVLRPLTKSAPAIAAQAVFNDKQLFIRVQCDPPGKQLPKRIWLLTEDNKTVPPVTIETSPAYGYALAKFDLTAPAFKQAETKVTDWSSLKPHQVLRLTVQVDPGDGSPVISTARTHTGAILLSKSHEPLTLTDIDVEEGALPHPFMYSMPDPK